MLRNASLRQKLLLSNTVPAVCSILIFTVAVGFYLRSQLRLEVIASLTSEAMMIGDNSAAAILFNDPDDATRILTAFRAKPAIIAAAIYDESGALLALYQRSASPLQFDLPYQAPDSGTVTRSNTIFLAVPIDMDGSQVGTVLIASDLGELTRLARRVAVVAIIVFGAVIIIMFGISTRLRNVILVPIQRLSQTAKIVTEEGDYAVRIEAPGSDEIGQLGATFNDMLDEIERHSELLLEREAYFRSLIENASDMVIVTGADGAIRYQSPAVESLLGHDREKRIGRPLLELVHPEDVPQAQSLIRKGFENPGTTWNMVFRARHVDGSWRTIDVVGKVHQDGDGEPLCVINGRDITDRQEVEKESKRLAEQLRQSQKMEAVGQLTGGLAHDFNNLLTVILGNLDLLLEEMAEDDPARQWANSAIIAGQSGASLTHQLLAFSRKQPLQPKVIDINTLVSRTNDLLRRTIGETIQIEIVSGAGLWKCEVDPVQLQNALLNLAINARDAMPEGGKLTIEAGNARLDEEYAERYPEVSVGQYVMLAVTDTGLGMPPEIVDQVFEPFFTTKDVGRGSGLGLSMVYGFVKQSGGHVRIYSEEGEGTSVKLYFPRGDAGAVDPAAGEARQDVPMGSGELILVVEDDNSVRELSVLLLERLGYRTLEAGTGREALQILESENGVILLFSDVVLPGGMGGADLAREATGRWPDLRVLFTSGYTEDAIFHEGRLDRGVELLPKPFTQANLAAKIAAVLTKQVS